ncbi:MAG: hypothetical protein V4750_07505 [Pseudomonadota bacterium]
MAGFAPFRRSRFFAMTTDGRRRAQRARELRPATGFASAAEFSGGRVENPKDRGSSRPRCAVAHDIMQAIRSGTPVLAARIPGNVGMVRPTPGMSSPLDAARLAAPLERCRDTRRY